MIGKILAIDYGLKRCGIAETDDLQLIASSLTTVSPEELILFLKQYSLKNSVLKIIIGQPTDLKGNMNSIEVDIIQFIDRLKIELPKVEIDRIDERFTSKMASQVIFNSGVNKKKRQEKSLIDKISATILLQNYLEYKNR